MKSTSCQTGVTLMELVVTLAILGILATIGVPVVLDNLRVAKNVDAQNTLKSIFLMEKNYFSENNCYFVSSVRTEINQKLFGSSVANNESPIAAPGSKDFVYAINAMSGTASCAQSYQATATISGTIYSINEQFVKSATVTDSQGSVKTTSW